MIGEDIFPLFLEVQRADMLAQSEYRREQKLNRLDGVDQIYQEIIREGQCVSLKKLAVSGKDLLEAGYGPGKQIGEILELLLEEVLINPHINKKEELLGMAKEKFPVPDN